VVGTIVRLFGSTRSRSEGYSLTDLSTSERERERESADQFSKSQMPRRCWPCRRRRGGLPESWTKARRCKGGGITVQGRRTSRRFSASRRSDCGKGFFGGVFGRR
jgi:hypothetical protein